MSAAQIVSAAALAVILVAPAACRRSTTAAGERSATFAALVDDYLDRFAARHPSIAAGNGIHSHDEALEDFSAGAIADELAWLRGVRRRLDEAAPAALTPDERVDRRILQGIVDGWVLDLGTLRTWTRNPMIYASAISDGTLLCPVPLPSAPHARATDDCIGI